MITNAVAVRAVAERNLIFFREEWIVLATGFIEPLLWILGIQTGLRTIVDDVPFRGQMVEYMVFVAPGLVAVAAMNGALFDSTFNFYFKLKHTQVYDSIVTTPVTIGNIVVGEAAWSVSRSTTYATAFLLITVVLGLIASPWCVLIIPVAALIGFSISAIGVFATTFVRDFHDFDYLALASQVLFMGSATFYPISVYPGWIQALVHLTPLYHGVALCRSLSLGAPQAADLGHVGALMMFTATCGWLANRRLEKALLV